MPGRSRSWTVAGPSKRPARLERRLIMFRRHQGRPTPAPVGGATELRNETSSRQAEADSRELRYLLERGCSAGWGWHYGELVCPLSWLFTPSRSHDQHPEERCDED